MPGRIIKLPDKVANQIAAGEVVERPVAVVKELVENALDAEARSIEIQFERGGKALIRVLDDGVGMSREDALMALQRHATSKIRKVEDILQIGSFGFRGEALPSIASVSRFTLKTRPRKDAAGTEIRVHDGREALVGDCGMSPGTEVTVANLFSTVPARRKFLKTERTESAHIIQMCRLLAVAHPEVAFSLIEDGHEVFQSPACPDRPQRILEIFGKRRLEDLIPVTFERDGIRIHGMTARPGSGRSTRAEMITYVNSRPVDSRLLNYALIESYHRFLPRGRYPSAFLFVDVPPEMVDVNVHPTKREVRFRNEPLVRSVAMNGLTDLLGRHSRRTLSQAEPVDPLPEAEAGPSMKTTLPDKPPAPKTPVPSPSPAARPFARREAFPGPGPGEADPSPAPERRPGAIWRFCGVFRGRVGLFESPDGLILLNGRAARERILFERIQRSLKGGEVPRQRLLIPAMLELPPLEAGVLADQGDFLDSLGFEIEPFGRHTFRVRSVPAWLHEADPESFLEDIAARIRERGIRPEEMESARSLIARMGAIREARGFVPEGEAAWQRLATELLECENPLLDARGKPAFVELRHGEISRKLMLDANPGALDGLEGGG